MLDSSTQTHTRRYCGSGLIKDPTLNKDKYDLLSSKEPCMNFIHCEYDNSIMKFLNYTIYGDKKVWAGKYIWSGSDRWTDLPNPDPQHLTHVCSCVIKKPLTLFDDEEAEGEDHGVAGEDVVPAVDVLPVDGQTHTRHQHEHALHDH